MGNRRTRRGQGARPATAVAVVVSLAVVIISLAVGASSAGPVRAPAEPEPVGPIAPASGDVSAFPVPGTATASPQTGVSFRGVDQEALGTVTVTGSVSGTHPASLLEHPDGRGVSVLPLEPFTPGERVTVDTSHRVRGAARELTFTVARTRPRTALAVPPVERQPPGVPVRRYVSEPLLQPPVVRTEVSGGTGPGYVVVGVKNGFAQKGPMLVDDAGQPVWFHPLSGVDARDVSVQDYRGEPVLTWWQGRQPVGFGYGEAVMVDQSYQEVGRFGMGNGYDADSHEVLITEQDTALLMGYEPVAMDLSPLGGPTDGTVIDNVVQEVDIATGAVLLEWHTLGAIGLDESYHAAGDEPFDYAHLNAIEVDRDGDLLISARHTCAVYKVDRETGDLLWRLGGRRSDFTLGEGARFLMQHDVRRAADGTLTLFDNGGACGEHERKVSRGIALDVDERARTATLVREYVHPERLFAESQGSFQVLPGGDVLLGWGSLPRWTQMSAEGDVLLDAQIPDELVITSYRARRHPWSGYPSTDPRAVVVPADPTGTTETTGMAGSTQATVRVSWNGATEVTSWRIMADGSEVAREPRTGFETAVPVPSTTPGSLGALVVEALGADGTVLGRTTALPPVPSVAGDLVYARWAR